MRFVRTPFLALMLAVAALAPPPSLQAAPVDSLPDTTGFPTPWRIVPAVPCELDSVFMIVRGFVATPCDSFISAEAVSPLFVRIRRLTYIDRRCPEPAIFYPVPLALGRFAAGQHTGTVELVTIQMRSDGSSTTLEQAFRFDFTVAADCSIPPPPTPGALPYVHSIGTEPPRACAGQPTSLVLEGVFTDGCGRVVDAIVHDPNNVELTLKPYVLPDTACTDAPTPWRQDFPLGLLASGPHRTNITLHVLVPDSLGPTFRRETYYGSHEFFVYGDCDSIPPPTQRRLPYVDRIVVGRDGFCGPVPPCQGDSIEVRVSGVFPNGCYSFRGIELISQLADTRNPMPPPLVRIIVDNGCCILALCDANPQPWSATVKLPPMISWDYYSLAVELAEVCCSNTYPPGQLSRTVVPFAVADSCTVPPPCLTVDFARGLGTLCNATVSKLQAAELTFLVRPTVALAGLEGEFRLDPPVLHIGRIEPIGPAEGMLIDWTQTSEGARFVLFAQSGAPIPPYPPVDMLGGGWPVLRVTVATNTRAGAEVPERTILTTHNLLGSDIDGQAVLLCPPPPCLDLLPRVSMGRAVICADLPCDFNVDGLQDVRDLVLMVRCVNDVRNCPWDVGTRFDCNGDGTFALADVLCCARHVLQRPPCPDCPPDTGQVRPEPGIAVSFGAPEEVTNGTALPLGITGVHRMGAAMLTLEAPLDRYDVVGFDVSPPGRWLALHEVRDGRIVLGLIDVQGGYQRAVLDNSRFTLTLALKPGQRAGGEVAVVAGKFSGSDGVTLGVELGRPSQTLPGAARVALSANQPNPFSTETAFTLELNEAADVIVGIYDLRGRSVANLHRAPLAAGPHVFRWNGRDSDGRSAPNGVYFYQATVGGRSLARKLILMRGN
jgi:flagellar hook capping protein FlgD